MNYRLLNTTGKSAGRTLGTLLLAAIMAVALTAASSAALAGVKIYVDTSAIDARTDLTDDEKTEVKNAIKQTIKENLEQAFGSGNVTVSDSASDEASADRTVSIPNDLGTDTDKSGKTTYHWGEWQHGSKSTTVHLKNYMDRWGATFKTDGKWDAAKLGKAIGTTAAHELGHSYSAGHDDKTTNKMSSAHSATELGEGQHFSDAAKKTVKENEGKPPCKTTTNYSTECCIADWWDNPTYPAGFEEHEPFAISTTFVPTGPLAPMFDFGWWGVDTDQGILDGNPWGDFVFKSSLMDPLTDADKITFFDGWTAHFVLRGKQGTPWAGQYIDLTPGQLVLLYPIVRPDGSEVFRGIELAWDVGGAPGPDVHISMNTQAYGPDSPIFSGFRRGIAPSLSVKDAKLQADGTYVSVANAVVTADFPTMSQPGYFYVESPNRSSGIRVEKNSFASPPISATVGVKGRLQTNADGERYISLDDFALHGAMQIKPLGIPNRTIGGGDFDFCPGVWSSGQQGVTGGVGLNNIGLLVRVWGKFAYVSPFSFTVDDGSGSPITCKLVQGPFLTPPAWDYVTLSGIVSCEKRAPDDVVPVILLNSKAQITPVL